MATQQSEAVGNFVARIKQTYSERRLNREKQWPPCKSEKLVSLELVEGEKVRGYSAGQTRGRDDKAIKRSPLAYSDILKAKDGKKIVRKVLVEGDAGIGKTTLCTALSEDWANGKLFQEFEILLLLHLRQKRIPSAGSLLGLLKLLHSSPEICELVAKHIEYQNEGKVLIIADGWDELSTKDCSEGSFLYELFFGERYSLSVIMTSRPSASAPLHHLPCIDRLVEVRGFSKDNIKEFIQCEFASDRAKCSGLLEQLEGNRLIESVCSVPLNCAIICHLWRTLEEAFPTTMSELYTKIILNVTLRNIQKRPEHERVCSLSHFDALPESLQQPWSLLCELAFQTLSEDKIVFSHEDLHREFQNLTLDSELLCFGLLQSAESILVHGHGVSFHFLHLTFQEYLAALYFVRQPTDKQLQLCHLHVESKRFEMVWRFFFGISFSIYKQTINPDISKVLLNAYYKKKKNDYLHISAIPLCHFALEANQRNMDALIVSKIKDCCDNVWFFAHTALDSSAAVHVLANLQDFSCTINLGNCGLDDKLITALAEALAGEHKKLKVTNIDLSVNELSDQSVAHLFDKASPAFRHSLRSVNLLDNKIAAKAIHSITTVLAKSLLVATESDDYDYDYDYDYDERDDDNDTCLIFSDNPLGVDGVRALRDALCASKLANLGSLCLAGSLTDDADTNAELILALGSGHCHSLRELDLSGNNLGEPGGRALGEVLLHLHSLVDLELYETQLGDKGISAFAQNLQDTCKVENLYLENNDIHAAGLSCLAESVCASFLSIDRLIVLDNNPLGLGGATAILKMLSSDHFLADDTSIYLSECQLTTAGGSVTNADYINAVDVQQLICNQQLKATCPIELVISNNNFSGEGIHVLAAFMYVCPYVERLFCRSCGITSDDLKQLLVLLSELRLKFSHLTTWSLRDNDIDNDGVSALIQHLSMFPKLNRAKLDGNIQVSPGILSTLKEKLDAPREEQYRPTEAGITAITQKDTEDRPKSSLLDRDSNVIIRKRRSSTPAPQPRKRIKQSEVPLPSSLDPGLFSRTQKAYRYCNGCSKIPVTPYRTSCDCKTLYCEACANEVTGCTRHSNQEITVNEDKSLKTKISKLKLRLCPNHQQGCKWEGGEVYRLRQHLSECAYYGKKKESKSRSQQEVVHLSTSSGTSMHVQRLDQVLDFEHRGVSKHLGQIADSMCEWEGSIAEHLELTPADVAAIKTKHPSELRLQTRAALEKWKQKLGSNATYSNLIKVFEDAGYKNLADSVKKIVMMMLHVMEWTISEQHALSDTYMHPSTQESAGSYLHGRRVQQGQDQLVDEESD